MWQVAPDDFESRVPEYWDWIAVALFLLVSVDLLTTSFAVWEFGLAVETNPAMRWLFARGPVLLTCVHLVVVVVGAGTCGAIIELIRTTPERLRVPMALAFETWLGLLLSLGLFLYANNLCVVVLGRGLL